MKQLGTFLIAACIACGLNYSARAQQWPERPVRVIVPFAAGGNTDLVARLVSQKLSESFGQPFVVENHAGAGGTIAAELVAHAPPDGNTLFVAALAQIAIAPAIMETRYDPLKDLIPISDIATNPYVLAVNPSVPVKTLAEFVDYVRARPGQLAYASAGVGTQTHLTMALFLKQANLDMIHVPYKGNAPAMADLVAGQVPAMVTNLSDAIPQVAAGKIRALAVTSASRMPQIPDIPTAVEAGYPTFKILTWNGFMAPTGTSPEIISKVAAEIARAVREPEVIDRLRSYGDEALGDTPAEFASTIAADVALWGSAVKLAGVSGK